jgi:hypothetical protein
MHKRPLDEMLRHLRQTIRRHQHCNFCTSGDSERSCRGPARNRAWPLVHELQRLIDHHEGPERSFAALRNPSELAADIERHLQNQPDGATCRYRLRKYVVRNRAAVAGLTSSYFSLSVSR